MASAVTAAFVLSVLAAWALVRLAPRFARIDAVGERSLHSSPTPRAGGLAFVAAVPVGFLLAARAFDWSIAWRAPAVALAVALPVAAVGLLDDLRECRALVRIAVHALAAVAGAFLVSDQPPIAWVALLGAVGIAWTVNLANFMDGADGFLASEAVTLFAFMGAASTVDGTSAQGASLGALAWVAAAGVAGFLCWNRPRARIFMGDVGSGWIGALVGVMAFGFLLTDPGIAYGSVALAAPFIADASICVLRRMARRERVWQAHAMHGYQHFVRRRGGSHAALLVAWTAANLLVYLPLAAWAAAQRSLVPFGIATALGCLQALWLGSGSPVAPVGTPR